jgi:hypothetical protein
MCCLPPARVNRRAPARLLGVLAVLVPASLAAAEGTPEPTVTVTFPAPARDRARMTVNADDPSGPPATFHVRVGTAPEQTFTRATPPAERVVEIPADGRSFVRFSSETGGAATQVLAWIPPSSRALLLPDACATWDLATSGASGSAACVDKKRFCPTFSRPSPDRALTDTQCGGTMAKFCVPDHRIDVSGEKGQKVRFNSEGTQGHWIPLRGRGSVRHLSLPSVGKCPVITVETGADSIRLVLAQGQGAVVRVDPTGQITAENPPPAARVSQGGSE